MFLRSVVGLIAVLFCVSSVNAVTFTVKPDDAGMILVWHQKTGAWAAVKEMSTLSIRDSLYLDDQRNATLQFGNGCTVLLKGELRATVSGSDSAVVIILDQGQLFI